jgi:hypothetical protein
LSNLLVFPDGISTLSWDQRLLLQTVRTFYLVAYFSMLRCSSLLPESRANIDLRRLVTWGKIRAHEGGIVLNIFLEKTLQFGDRVHELALASRPGSLFCPVAALYKLADLRSRQHCGPDDLIFLVKSSSSSWVPLAKNTVLDVMRAQLKSMKVDPATYAFHSFRRGAIQAAVRVQPSLELIRLQSGHVSDAIHVYTQMPGASRMVTAIRMLDDLDRNPLAA